MADPTSGANEPFIEQPAIDSTFRNGSLAVIGVVSAFSLGFLSRWAGLPGDWTSSDIMAILAITLGIALQIKALADMLSIASLVLANYNRAIRLFKAGLVLVAIGVIAAIFADVLGLGGTVLRGS